MNKVAQELDQRLQKLDRATAEHVERLVLDALALASGSAAGSAPQQWPQGYFERTAGALAGEAFERPEQGTTPTREGW
jgi:hypothetical protein